VKNDMMLNGTKSMNFPLLKRWLLLGGLFAGCCAGVQAQTVVQTFFIPFDEEEINIALNTIDDFGGAIGNTVRSTISIVGGITNSVLFWDHWEDGYEYNILVPTQSTTQIWGDNNPANGIPPGFASDRVNQGDIVSLINDIPIPRSVTNLYYDGRDKLSVTRWVAVSRYLYAPSPGEVLADACQVYDRSKFGFDFRAPVGINTGTNQMFEYSALHIAAGYDSTVVRVDIDADGNFDETLFLNEGESHVSRFVFQGARVEASKPVQSHLITGDIGSNYEMRFYELFPSSQWDTNYFTSAHSVGSISAEVYFHNPNSTELDVVCETLFSTSTVNVAAFSTATFLMPTNSGANFTTTNGLKFIPISAMDSQQAISGNQAYDWGQTLVPVRALTTVGIVPWAPGAGGNPLSSDNGNPLWVTASSDTTLYIDYDGNSATGPLIDPYGRRYNFSTNVIRLQSVRIFDNTDNDQTGLRIYTLDEARFTTAWGQDPSAAQPGNPYLDMGMAIFPFPTVPAVKEWALFEDINDDGVVNPGDSIRFTIYVINVGYSDANNVVIYDSGASNTAYTLGSSFLNNSNILDDVVPPATTEFPFDEIGYNVGFIAIGHTATVSYVVMIDDPFPTNTDGIVNGVYVDNQTEVFVPVPIPGFNMTKSSATNVFEIGNTISYAIDIISTANVFQTGVQVNDQLPTTITYVPNSTRVFVNGQFTGNFLDQFNTALEYNGDDGALRWNGDWQEIGEANGAGSGNIQVMTDVDATAELEMLRIQGSDSSINIGAMRRADIRRFTNATLRFDYRRDSLDSSSEIVSVSASSNGGTSWTILTNLAGAATDVSYTSVSNLNLNPFISTNFAVRFLANSSMTSGDRVWIDNVQVIASGNNVTNIGGAPPLLISNYGINSGQSVRITFDATINGNIAVSQIVNRVFINSFASPAPLEASVTNYVNLPNRSLIAGWVRNDLNADGNVANTSYPGISAVPITLYTDPNRDGNPADGVVVASTFTQTNGYFELGNFLSNSYVVLETDLINWRSTADSDGGNSNRVSFTTASGVNYTNNIFLDTRLAFISGQVRYDADGDGDFDDVENGIPNVSVTLYTDPNQDGFASDGVAVSSRVTNIDGEFVFEKVEPGYYVVVQTDLSDLISIADNSGANDNQIGVYLPGGVDFPGLVYLDTSSGLTITKTSSPPGIWFPTLSARYMISVVNTGLFTHTGVTITDLLGAGLSHVPGSTHITTILTGPVLTSRTVRDDFSSASYSLNTGNTNWLGNWIEENETTSASSGGIIITGGRLRMNNQSGVEPAIYRAADLRNAIWAQLSFAYEASNNIDSADNIILDISTNSGSSYTTLTNFTDISGSRSGNPVIDISSYASTNTRIRFRVDNNDYSSSDEFFRLNWIQIAFTNSIISVVTNSFVGAAPPNMASGYSMAPGNSITIVFTAVVDIAVSGVTNTACVVSDIVSNGLCSTVFNSVDPNATPDRISGQVRFDSDGDGNLGDIDFGIQGVNLSIYTDPNGDGNQADGALVDSTVSDINGYYIFGDLSSGSYVVVETDLSGYESTADSQGANDNRIAVLLAGGVDARDNDFLDWTISGLTIHKTSSAGNIVVPGDSIVYSIIVSNARNTIANGVRIVDYLPQGVIYVPSSTVVNIQGIVVTNSVRDLFNAVAFTNQDGNINWSTNWLESNDTTGPSSGSIVIASDFGINRLRLSALNRSIRRTADISGGQYATLSYYYRRQSLEVGEYVMVEISTNQNTWVELARHTYTNGGLSSQSDSSYQFISTNILPYASTGTTIRFRTPPSGNMNTADFVWFDDVGIDFGYTVDGSGSGLAPPTLVSNQTLAAGGVITVSFTANVEFVDSIVNTAIVFTASDNDGLRAYASNIVGIVSMTQGMVIAGTEAGDLGVQVGWSAYMDEAGEVSREYDVLYVDETAVGFSAALSNQWTYATTIQDKDFVDVGEGSRLSPDLLGNKMRFYRASFKDTWGMEKNPRYATKEIYVAKCVNLLEGENFISLFMVPDVNQVSRVFGTDLLPAGSSMNNSTRIEWYASTAASEATNVIWLSDAGVWQHAGGGIANTMPLPLNKGFNIIIPPGAGDQKMILVGRVPTNATPELGHTVSIVASQNYNIVSYNVPYRVKLIDSGLKESGFKGVSPGRPFNPNESDELRILRKGGGSLQAPILRILMNSSGQFYFWTGGSGVADNVSLEPEDALIIYTRKSTTNWTWNISLPYPAPNLWMTP